MKYESDVLVIGAGPSGAIAAALLKRKGHHVRIVERQKFPRFSIGESLLAHCLDFVAEAGMMEAIDAAGFQFKNGAAFVRDGKYTDFDFGQQYTAGRGTTLQVQRAHFDKVLADEAERQGVDIHYEVDVISADFSTEQPRLTARDAQGELHEYTARFVLDGSGFGRTLPRLLDLDYPSQFPVRNAVFTHVEDTIVGNEFDRSKIRVTIHPQHRDVWFWLIPFSNGRCSLGVVARAEFFTPYSQDLTERLQQIVAEDKGLSHLLRNAKWDTPARELGGYSANVRAMHGPGFALLGNAAEFLDPVFSSGVTIAMKSASLAASVLDRQLQGETVNWETEFAKPLKQGVDAFRAYVEAWYDGRFQDVIFYEKQATDIKAKICSILAGYAWDLSNPFVTEPERRLNVLAELCRIG